ncbi:MAG: DUF4143 domain-containing protein, partial [Candidatus Eisenbacteria bacterium]|nr:DUF4143 domain-containing protein [Candidatus Eisenbacteria bacterium]
ARLTEQVIANELFYRFDRPDWFNSRVFFWKNGGEIDFIVKREKELLPVEVKYQKNAGFQDLRTIKRLGFKRGILISMDRLEMEDGFAIIPVEIFLLATR